MTVLEFPSPRRRLGVRLTPSERLDGWLEVQCREEGEWRVKAIFQDETDAKWFLAECIVKELYASRLPDDDAGDIPF